MEKLNKLLIEIQLFINETIKEKKFFSGEEFNILFKDQFATYWRHNGNYYSSTLDKLYFKKIDELNVIAKPYHSIYNVKIPNTAIVKKIGGLFYTTEFQLETIGFEIKEPKKFSFNFLKNLNK